MTFESKLLEFATPGNNSDVGSLAFITYLCSHADSIAGLVAAARAYTHHYGGACIQLRAALAELDGVE